MSLPLETIFSPSTSSMGFINVDLDSVVQAFLSWMQPISAKVGRCLIPKRTHFENLGDSLHSLLPLSNNPKNDRTHLFLPTNSSWTAYFTNNYRGTDSTSVVAVLSEKLRCQTMRVTAFQKKGYEANIWGVYDSSIHPRRCITCMDDDGWIFEERGEPFKFESLNQYQIKKKRDRFTLELFERYLKEMGLSPFDPNFYLPPDNKSGTLIKSIPIMEYPLWKIKEFLSAKINEDG